MPLLSSTRQEKNSSGRPKDSLYGASLGSDASQQVNLLGDYSDGIYNIGSRTDMSTYMGLIIEVASSNRSL